MMHFLRVRKPSLLASAVRIVALGGALALVASCSSTGKGSGHGTSAPPSSVHTSVPSKSPTTAPAAPDACTLLTKAEAEAVARTPLMAPVGAGAQGSTNTLCQFTGPTTGPTAQVEVFSGDGAKKQLDIDRDTLKHTFVSVPGIGDQCFQEDDFIFAEKDGVWASINLVRLNDAKDNVTVLQVAMKQVVARLP